MDGSNESIVKQRRQLQEMAHAYRKSQVLLSCVELGVFDALAGCSASAAEVAHTLAADAHAVEILLNAATALGLVQKHGSNFSNSPLAETQLTQSTTGGMVQRLRMERTFYCRWQHLVEAVRSGKRPEEIQAGEQPEGWVRSFIYGLYDHVRPVAPLVAEALALPEGQPVRVLDVGGGHGGYSIALAQRYPNLTATVFELPRVVPVAREIIEKAGLSERLQVQAGDFQQQELGSGYDMALVFGVLNGEPVEKRPPLIHKVFSALNPGGQIVLRDQVLEPDRTAPPEATLFAVQLLLSTDGGGLDTREDWALWLASAGFTTPQTIELPPWVGFTLTIARKPK